MATLDAADAALSVSEQCRSCIATLKTAFSALSSANSKSQLEPGQVNAGLERFSLWVGNIGALHMPESPLSMESRLQEAKDVLSHVQELLRDLTEVSTERK
jgi:hypothetical protein